MIDRERILTASEVRLVLGRLLKMKKRSRTSWRRLIVFRLATCCGLRATEICDLRLGDVRFGIRPILRVRSALKRGRKRVVPLNWDGGTLSDLKEWYGERVRVMGENELAYLLTTRNGLPMDRHGARDMFRQACKILRRPVTIHDGRHTFISHALHQGHSISEVMAAVGHKNMGTTGVYAHLVGDDDERIGSLFGRKEALGYAGAAG